MRKKTTLPPQEFFVPRTKPEREVAIEQLRLLENYFTEFNKGNYPLTTLAQRCSFILRKFFGKNGLITNNFMKEHGIRFHRLNLLEKEQTINLSSVVTNFNMTITKTADADGRPIYPHQKTRVYAKKNKTEITCQFPLHGFNFDYKSGQIELGSPTIFDYSTPMDDVESWRNQFILNVNSANISIRDVISVVANLEEAHPTTDENPPPPSEKNVVSSITIANEVTYAHLFVISLSLYVLDNIDLLISNPEKINSRMELPIPIENGQLKTPDKLLGITGYVQPVRGLSLHPPRDDEEPVVHKIRIIVPEVRSKL